MEDIVRYLHCTKCLEELPPDEEPRTYSRLQVCATGRGDLIIECVRHNEEVAHFDNDDLPEAIATLGNAMCACGRAHPEETKH